MQELALQVTLVGMVHDKEERATDVSFQLDDTTGQIEVKRWSVLLTFSLITLHGDDLFLMAIIAFYRCRMFLAGEIMHVMDSLCMVFLQSVFAIVVEKLILCVLPQSLISIFLRVNRFSCLWLYEILAVGSSSNSTLDGHLWWTLCCRIDGQEQHEMQEMNNIR